MPAFQVGSPAINRAATQGDYSATIVDHNVSSPQKGRVKKVQLWTPAAANDVSVATIYIVSGNNLSTRDYLFLGSIPAGYSEWDVDLEIEVGDWIGVAGNPGGDHTGFIDIDAPLGNAWLHSGRHIPCTNLYFDEYSWTPSIHGDCQSPGGGGFSVAARAAVIGV